MQSTDLRRSPQYQI